MRFNVASVDSFICHYLYLGFAHLLLYADDQEDPIVAVARRYPPDRVTITLRNTALERAWARRRTRARRCAPQV